MPYHLEHVAHDAKPWKIVDTATGKVVGSSDDEEKAKRSISYREDAENKAKEKDAKKN